MRLVAAIILAILGVAPGPVVLARPLPDAMPPGVDPGRLDRARSNYVALREGRRQVAQLSIQELEDVSTLDRALRDQASEPRTTSQRCVDTELRLLGTPPSALARRVIDIKCREAGEPLR